MPFKIQEQFRIMFCSFSKIYLACTNVHYITIYVHYYHCTVYILDRFVSVIELSLVSTLSFIFFIFKILYSLYF